MQPRPSKLHRQTWKKKTQRLGGERSFSIKAFPSLAHQFIGLFIGTFVCVWRRARLAVFRQKRKEQKQKQIDQKGKKVVWEHLLSQYAGSISLAKNFTADDNRLDVILSWPIFAMFANSICHNLGICLLNIDISVRMLKPIAYLDHSNNMLLWSKCLQSTFTSCVSFSQIDFARANASHSFIAVNSSMILFTIFGYTCSEYSFIRIAKLFSIWSMRCLSCSDAIGGAVS